MDHHDAVRLSLVEKYLLGELPPELRDEFEEHYFDCQECGADLRATAAFLDAAKKELKAFPDAKHAPTQAKKSRLGWLWSPAFVLPALAACLLVIAYQNIVIFPHFRSALAQLRAPEILPSVSLVGGNSRGGQTPSITVRGAQPFLVLVDIPPQDRFSSYTCLLYSPSGSLTWRLQVSAQLAKDTVSIRVPSVNRMAGSYSLVVKGNTDQSAGETGIDLAHYRFMLNIQD
jgi:hypothetical protein